MNVELPLEATEGGRFAFLKWYHIIVHGLPYLSRLRIVDTPWFGVYLHKIMSTDGQDPHDHPYSFVSLVLRGGYVEELDSIYEKEVVPRRTLSLHKLNFRQFHRITQLEQTPTWTLVVRGRRRQNWGFLQFHDFNTTLNPYVKIPHQEYD